VSNAVTMHKMGPNKEYILISSMAIFSNNQSAVFIKQSDLSTKSVTLTGTGSVPMPTGDSFGNFIPDVGDYGLVVLNPSGSIAWYDYTNDALLTTPVGSPYLISSGNDTWYYYSFSSAPTLVGTLNILKFPTKVIITSYDTTGEINHVFEILLTSSLSLNDITSNFTLAPNLNFNYLNDTYFVEASTSHIALVQSSDYTHVWTIPLTSFSSFSLGGDDPVYILSGDGKTLYFFYEDVNGNPFVAPIDITTGVIGSISTVPVSAAYAAGTIGVTDNGSDRLLVWPGEADILDLTNGAITAIASPNFNISVNADLVEGFVDGNGSMVVFLGDSSTNKLYMKIIPKGSTTGTEYNLAVGTNDRYAASLMWDDTTLYLLYPYASTQTKLFEFKLNQVPNNIPITIP